MKLLKKYISLPSKAKFEQISADFEVEFGYPEAISAIDGCHINLKMPLEQ